MTNDEILQTAKEAGFKVAKYDSYVEIQPCVFGQNVNVEVANIIAIIEKRTIERCEAACNSLIKRQRKHEAAYGIGYLVYDAEDCAAAIRKLGEQ